MRVIVCGGRDYADWTAISDSLDAIHAERPITQVITGDARGADTLAGMWAMSKNVKLARYPAKWVSYGRSSGPIRNAEMLAKERPDEVIAFPGGKGTADMVRQARAAGVPVREIVA